MSCVEVILSDPSPDEETLCTANGETCQTWANAEVSLRIHGMMLRDELLLCADHLNDLINDLGAGRFDEVDEIAGTTITHVGVIS